MLVYVVYKLLRILNVWKLPKVDRWGGGSHRDKSMINFLCGLIEGSHYNGLSQPGFGMHFLVTYSTILIVYNHQSVCIKLSVESLSNIL